MSSRTETRTLVENMVAQLISFDPIDAEMDIFEAGLMNSLLALQLVNRLEKLFAMEIDEDDLERANFASIANMTEFVLRKQARRDA